MKDLQTIIRENEQAVLKHVAQSGGRVVITIDVSPAQEVSSGDVLVPVSDYPEVLWNDFYGFSVVVDKNLTPSETSQVAGAIGYALRQVLHGEDLSNPDVTHGEYKGKTSTAFDFGYDSTKSRSDDPDFERAFELAREYIQNGSPIRKTNQAGPNTKGTRLVEGIGAVRVEFFVPIPAGEARESYPEK